LMFATESDGRRMRKILAVIVVFLVIFVITTLAALWFYEVYPFGSAHWWS